MQPELTLTAAQLRAGWTLGHGLDAPNAGDVLQTIARAGWPRTLGGVDVYLSLLARNPDLDPAALDRAVCVDRAAEVVPAARGCIYVVPASEVATCLRFADQGWLKRTLRDCEKAGVSRTEFEAAVAAVGDALDDTPLATEKLRERLPAGVVRSLGEAGKKVGMSTVLPAAIRALEFQGLAARTQADGHLRNERYVWRRRSPDLSAAVASTDPLTAHRMLAQHYFAVAAPARVRDFADWAGLGLKDAQAAVVHLDLLAATVAGCKEPYLLPAVLADRLREAVEVRSPRLLSLVDPLLDYRGNALPALFDPDYHGIELPAPGGKSAPIAQLTSLWQRCIFDGGAMCGIWEFDPDARAVVVAPFRPLAVARQRLLRIEIERTTVLLRDRLGDARAYSLDSDKSLRERTAWVRASAARWA